MQILKLLLILNFVIFGFIKCTEKVKTEFIRSSLKLPDSRFFVTYAFNEIPIVIPISYSYDSSIANCYALLEDDDGRMQTFHFYSKQENNCISVIKDTLTGNDTVCINLDDSLNIKKAVRTFTADGIKTSKINSISKCNKYYSVEASWMNLNSKDTNIQKIYAYMLIRDFNRKHYYSVKFGEQLKTSKYFKISDIESMIRSNIEILDVIYQRNE